MDDAEEQIEVAAGPSISRNIYQCAQCSRQFARIDHLTRHVRTRMRDPCARSGLTVNLADRRTGQIRKRSRIVVLCVTSDFHERMSQRAIRMSCCAHAFQ